MGLFELTSLDIDRTGEGSPAMAEQFAFHQPLGNGCAVDADKRMGTAVAQVVNRLGNELFTGSGFAGDQDRAIRYGNLGKIVFSFSMASDSPMMVGPFWFPSDDGGRRQTKPWFSLSLASMLCLMSSSTTGSLK